MKKIALLLIGGILGIGALFVLLTMPKYNEMVKQDENVGVKYGQLQNQLRRQFELIPNLVATVKAETKFETETFVGVAEARSKAGGVINMDASKLANDPDAVKKVEAAQQSIAQTLGRLMAVQEKYPELKSSAAFKNLATQIEGAANRVGIARRDVQNAINPYNIEVRNMPGKLVALVYGFRVKPYFDAGNEAQSGSDLVKFDK